MIIRIAEYSDIDALNKIQSQCFSKDTFENFEYLLSSENYLIFLAENDNSIIGYICASVSGDSSDILQICVIKQYRRQKIASALLLHYLSEMKKNNVCKVLLEVNEHNYPAINLYLSHGFSVISERKNYYGKESALIMQINL